MIRRPPRSTLFPYTTLFRSLCRELARPRQFAATAGSNVPSCLCQTTALRSEEHTSELQSQSNLVCRLLLEKKKQMLRSCACHATQLVYSSSVCTHMRLRYRI